MLVREPGSEGFSLRVAREIQIARADDLLLVTIELDHDVRGRRRGGGDNPHFNTNKVPMMVPSTKPMQPASTH